MEEIELTPSVPDYPQDIEHLTMLADAALGPMLIPLPTPTNAKKSHMKVVEELDRGKYKVTIYRYKVTNYGYTLTAVDSEQSSSQK
jgi:hypothetical protein